MFGERLRDMRIKNKVSQKKLADYLDVSRSAVSMWEINQSEPDIELIKKIAVFFNTTTDYLLGKNDSKSDDVKPEESRSLLSDDDIKFALFNGDQEITNEMYEEVKRFAQFIQEKYKMKRDEGKENGNNKSL